MAAPLQVLVLGASGMLGSVVRQTLARGADWRLHSTQREDRSAPDYFDILEMPGREWAAVLQRHAYDYIVNCIGILKAAVDEQDAKSLAQAIRVNALFPYELAALAPHARIFHVSTDGVFSGKLTRPYVETDPTDCSDAYGKTKALGECPAHNVLNIRCSLIGRDRLGGKGLLEWVLRSPENATLTGFDDQHWNGVTTQQFAELCRRIIESGAFDQLRRVSGLHHFCPNPALSKYELLCRIREATGRHITVLRGQSGAASARVLGSVYSGLRDTYPGNGTWDSAIRDAIAGD